MMEASVKAFSTTGITTEIMDDLIFVSIDRVIGHLMRDSNPWYQLFKTQLSRGPLHKTVHGPHGPSNVALMAISIAVLNKLYIA